MDYAKLLEKYLEDNRALGISPKDVLRNFVSWLNEQAAQQRVQTDGVCTCANVDDDHRGTWLVCGVCLKPRRR